MSSTNTSSSSRIYSNQLELYHQSGDICAFLNISLKKYYQKKFAREKELAEKFVALETAGFHLSSSSILEVLFPSILRQFAVSQCSYEQLMLTIKSSETDPFALSLLDAVGLRFSVLPELILPSSVSMLAVLFNISLLIVTARKISMSTVCNWLIAFDSLCQIPALIPFLINLCALCVQMESIDHRVCLVSLMLSTGSSYASFLAIFFMSFERLLIVMFPMRMSQISEKTIKQCSLLAVFACSCFGIVMILNIFNIWITINSAMDSRLYCCPWFFADALSMYYVSHTILGLALLNYVLIASRICWRRIYVPRTQTDSIHNAAYSQTTRRMLRSVFIITLILLFGWLFGSVLFNQILFIINELSINVVQASITGYKEGKWSADKSDGLTGSTEWAWFASNLDKGLDGLAMCLYPVAAGINAPVLIINNSDYRVAYKKTLASLLLRCRKRTSTVAVGPLFNNHHQ